MSVSHNIFALLSVNLKPPSRLAPRPWLAFQAMVKTPPPIIICWAQRVIAFAFCEDLHNLCAAGKVWGGKMTSEAGLPAGLLSLHKADRNILLTQTRIALLQESWVLGSWYFWVTFLSPAPPHWEGWGSCSLRVVTGAIQWSPGNTLDYLTKQFAEKNWSLFECA